MRQIRKTFLVLILSFYGCEIFAQCDKLNIYKDILSKYIEIKKAKSIIDTIYIQRDSTISTEIPSVVNNVQIKLLNKDDLYCSFIALTHIEFQGNYRKVFLKEYLVNQDDKYIGYEGGYYFIYEIKKHNKISIKKIDKINY
jgi:hypothetical protein